MQRAVSKELLPIAMGNEEETGMMIDTGKGLGEPYDLVSKLDQFVPDGLQSAVRYTHNGLFLSNGFLMYAGGAVGAEYPTNLERATPECSSPEQLLTYSRASELLLSRTVEKYLKIRSEDKDVPVKARMHRRAVDSAGSRKACHDSFGYSEDVGIYEKSVLVSHMATRSFITGAGYIKSSGIDFSQKINGLKKVYGYGYMGTMIRNTNQEGGDRVEVRCSDPNISDWATFIRIGSSALALALGRAQLIEPSFAGVDGRVISFAKSANRMRLGGDGSLIGHSALMQSVDYQQNIAEKTLQELILHTDLPLEYYAIAEEIYNFCDDFRAVAAGDKPVSILADRADWAAKMTMVNRSIGRDSEFGIKRSTKDTESKAIDLRYDMTIMEAEEGKIVYNRRGYGHKIRDKGNFRINVKKDKVAAAYRQAPQDTRAGVRSMLIKTQPVKRCDWEKVVLRTELEPEIDLRDVRQTALKPDDYFLLH